MRIPWPYCDGQKSLPWSDIRRIGLEILDALAALHPRDDATTPGILHRDIKPANILLEERTGRVKLIDFNIASNVTTATGRAGTPRYWAPDRGQPSWLPNADLFSMGLVLYELVVHRHPFPNSNPELGAPADPRSIPGIPRVSSELASFLLKAIDPVGARRFQAASDMREALQHIQTMHAPSGPSEQSSRRGEFPGLTLEVSEARRLNYNPYVTRLLTLFSQATQNNAGTRGLDEIARLTYVETKLDSALAPAIADGRFRLVIVTGNAGDGKTAFLQQVETFFSRRGAEVRRLPSANGAAWRTQAFRFSQTTTGPRTKETSRTTRSWRSSSNHFRETPWMARCMVAKSVCWRSTRDACSISSSIAGSQTGSGASRSSSDRLEMATAPFPEPSSLI